MASVLREEWNREWAEHARADHGLPAQPDSLLPPVARDLTPGRALDLGCGDGQNAIWLAEQGWRVTGVDFADAAIEAARRNANERGVDADFVVADLTVYQPSEAPDFAFLFYVHPSAEDRARMLATASNALAAGGRLLFVGHDRSDPGIHGDHIPADLLTTTDEIVAELPGLEIERADVVEHEIAFDDESIAAVSTVVVARKP